MYGIDKEIKGLERTLDLLFEKKEFLEEELVLAQGAQKFALKKQVANLENEIDTYREKLNQLAQQSGVHTAAANPEVNASFIALESRASALKSSVQHLQEEEGEKKADLPPSLRTQLIDLIDENEIDEFFTILQKYKAHFNGFQSLRDTFLFDNLKGRELESFKKKLKIFIDARLS